MSTSYELKCSLICFIMLKPLPLAQFTKRYGIILNLWITTIFFFLTFFKFMNKNTKQISWKYYVSRLTLLQKCSYKSCTSIFIIPRALKLSKFSFVWQPWIAFAVADEEASWNGRNNRRRIGCAHGHRMLCQ